jgi:hypothetical protein
MTKVCVLKLLKLDGAIGRLTTRRTHTLRALTASRIKFLFSFWKACFFFTSKNLVRVDAREAPPRRTKDKPSGRKEDELSCQTRRLRSASHNTRTQESRAGESDRHIYPPFALLPPHPKEGYRAKHTAARNHSARTETKFVSTPNLATAPPRTHSPILFPLPSSLFPLSISLSFLSILAQQDRKSSARHQTLPTPRKTQTHRRNTARGRTRQETMSTMEINNVVTLDEIRDFRTSMSARRFPALRDLRDEVGGCTSYESSCGP